MRSFLVAVAFLTVVPVRFRKLPAPDVVAASRFWYPAVGLLLGAAGCGKVIPSSERRWSMLMRSPQAPRRPRIKPRG